MRKKVIVKLFFMIFLAIIFMLLGSYKEVQAIQIDENRYPGYKRLIDNMQRSHPNWDIKLHYTGLNWDDVISGEYVGHGSSPTNLSYYTYKGEWICPICGEDKLYDVSHNWYCASRKAIAYMMDPRNSLTEEWVFQFQNLGSASGTWGEIQKMTEGTFLSSNSCIDAIMGAAQTYQISPFHLVSRITHEQGVSGMGTMNGYWYTPDNGIPVKVYNLFNIQVSGNNTEQGFLAGAKVAYENGWFTQEASIRGGAKFLREKYIDKGQSTLYFQKYNVVDRNNLYRHQYMQNIRAANDEGNKIYKAYKNSGILDSHFDFVIPVYENMPKEVSPRPLTQKPTYSADLGTQVIDTKIITNEKGEGFISGEMYVSEFIDGKTWSIPRTQPIMRIKTTTGEYIQNVYVKTIEGNKYYFDFSLDALNISKQYVIEVESGSAENISPYKIVTASFTNNINMGRYKRSEVSIIDSKIVFSPTKYNGDVGVGLIELKLNKNEQGASYLSGNVAITEWIDGTWNIPDVLPSIKIKTKEGQEVYTCWVSNVRGNEYYFDSYIEGIDTQREYIIEAKLMNPYNKSNYTSANMLTGEQILGKYDEYNICIKEQKLKFELEIYSGDIGNEIIEISLNQNAEGKSYISGNIYITEWINGTIWSIPRKLPSIKIKTKEGQEVYTCWVSNVKGNEYYFDSYIEGIDTQKEYVIEVELASKGNISLNKKARAYYGINKKLGMYKGKDVKIENSILTFGTKGQYRGDIGQQLIGIYTNKNEKGQTYISGNIYITEWINGSEWSIPRDIPRIKIKTKEGQEVYTCWVSNTSGNEYYFDSYIEGIDIQKEYVIEIELSSKDNISTYKAGIIDFGNKKEIGEYRNCIIQIEKTSLKFKAKQMQVDTLKENELIDEIEDKQVQEEEVVKEELPVLEIDQELGGEGKEELEESIKEEGIEQENSNKTIEAVKIEE